MQSTAILKKAQEKLAFQLEENEKSSKELEIAKMKLAAQTIEKGKRTEELKIASIELDFQKGEKIKRAKELVHANLKLEKHRLENEKRALGKRSDIYSRSLIEASLDPLFTINPAGKITDMNNASINVTGVTRKNLLGSDFFNYFTEPDKARKIYQQVFAKGFVADYPLTIRDHQLTDVLFNGSVYKDEDGVVLGVVVVARDITEQKNTEKELIEAKIFAELATEIAEKAKRNAESATILAKGAAKAKQQFLSNMSHEIRTPMNAIIGFTKVVLKSELTSKQREHISAIKISGDALIVLINDILDLAKVDAGKMIFEQIPFKLSASLASMLHLFEFKIQEKNLSLISEYDERIPKVLIGDPARLHQIILNLLSNAVKFTSKGNIKVSVKLLNQTPDVVNVEFSVCDTGIGLEDDKLNEIFENFQQAHSDSTRHFGGTGLGLAIVKQLVESQGGFINVKSELNVGSVFIFNLQFKKTDEEVEFEESHMVLETEFTNNNVLVVEDVPLNQLLMKTILEDFGFVCDIAANGKEAIEKMEMNTYDIILMDLQMPVMNGFETTEYIRKTLKSDIPIIALTADVTTVDLPKCKEIGMDEYISKPIHEKKLYRKIIALIKKRKLSKTTKYLEKREVSKSKCIDLNYLILKTKSDPNLMKEMILLYLEQTPLLINTMKRSYLEKDWPLLNAALHKMLPSFSVVGISSDYEGIVKEIQDYANKQMGEEDILSKLNKIEDVCTQACLELEEEIKKLSKTNNEK